MKINRIRELRAEGKIPIGHMISEFGTRGVAKITEAAGVDFVIIDMEHSANGIEAVGDLVAWFRATRVTPMVRIPDTEYHFIARALDAGALGIMVPRVDTPEQAQRAVEAARYPPEGRRGLAIGMAVTDYVYTSPAEYMPEANRNNLVMCQIETQTGLDNVDAIAALDGVDVLFLGQQDLSHSLGIVAEYEHPRFIEALREITAAAKRHGKAAAAQPMNARQAREWIDLGFNVISWGADLAVYELALKAAVEDLRRIEDAG